MAQRVKKGEMVEIIAGAGKGRQGKVLSVDPKKDRVVVEGVNVVMRHVRPSRQNPQGGRLQVEKPIHISNVLPINSKTGKGTRVRYQSSGGKKQRVALNGDVI
jgi:large subunit ribosomal protein L24